MSHYNKGMYHQQKVDQIIFEYFSKQALVQQNVDRIVGEYIQRIIDRTVNDYLKRQALFQQKVDQIVSEYFEKMDLMNEKIDEVVKNYLDKQASEDKALFRKTFAHSLMDQYNGNNEQQISLEDIKNIEMFVELEFELTPESENIWYQALSSEQQYGMMKLAHEHLFLLTSTKEFVEREAFYTNEDFTATIKHNELSYAPNAHSKIYKLPFCKGKFSSDACSVCLEEFEEKLFVLELQCKHTFHIKCLTSWFRQTTQCPLCRSPVGTNFEYHYQVEMPFDKNGPRRVLIRLTTEPQFY
ncbi:hypothetical protein HELRODRAFT_172460 [Helobdella robusta]|uniref:RING-type domain-containing protein n=1 Tax=Helobdella robusta TaxID=6412 RepID=T1F5C8_HELRO|nr:hypothetical protein HELRODRAFT_172460 [Helobdella robusta]ESO04787.1 hypothetical protein HELRODRAFT_172460 [Helobdella robusta]